MGSAYHVATGNRLPYQPVDLDAGETIQVLEIPCFDSGDDDRLSNFHYGPKMNRADFVDTVETRLDYAARHNLMASYLIHGWTAGVTTEEGKTYGALDAQRMLPLSIKMAKDRHLISLGCEEIYDWWIHRLHTSLELSTGTVDVEQPSYNWSMVLEFVPPSGTKLELAVDGEPVVPEVWIESGRERYLLPVRRSCQVQILRLQKPARAGGC
jgi:hypothetical protein